MFQQSKLSELLIRLCANKATKESLLAALEEELKYHTDSMGEYAKTALYNPDAKPKAFKEHGAAEFIGDMIAAVQSVK